MASLYKILMEKFSKRIGTDKLLKFGLNISPMYRRSTAKVQYMSPDLMVSKVRIPISWKNRNYMNSVYGGSMFSAVDPIPMMQLIEILGKEYVVWDKAATIYFKRPTREDLFFEIVFTDDEVNEIKERVQKEKEIDFVKSVFLTDKKKDKTFCQIDKVLYVAEKEFYLEKKKAKNHQL